ncbi:MAG: thioesterase family protein [Alphaproteobacteria bacterium]|nr:thioesterase family protein [Alphaproteobacteria bacterium]
MLSIGIKYTIQLSVSSEHTAKTIQSGGLDVLATPTLIGLMEKCTWQSVSPFMENGYDTVGTEITMKHLSPTPIGGLVKCESELISVNGRELTFHITAYDNCSKIGEAIHKRFIIKTLSFQGKATEKLTQS